MASIVADSNDPALAAVAGIHTAGASAVFGQSADGRGVVGVSTTQAGVEGNSTDGIGVIGVSVNARGIVGVSGPQAGVEGNSTDGVGVIGVSVNARGIVGVSGPQAGVEGNSTDGVGVIGVSVNARGIVGVSGPQAGVEGNSTTGIGVIGTSESGRGIFGRGTPAGFFEGNVVVDGNIELTGDLLLAGADYAEALTAGDTTIMPGTVVVVSDDGRVRPCTHDYDTAVAGIVSGAGGVRPAIVLDRHDGSVTVALVGKVWCLADADSGPINPGHLLTTSTTRGHARRVTEPARAFGAVIGKALTPLSSGRGMVHVLVSSR